MPYVSTRGLSQAILNELEADGQWLTVANLVNRLSYHLPPEAIARRKHHQKVRGTVPNLFCRSLSALIRASHPKIERRKNQSGKWEYRFLKKG
jgi:hypothetical protein